MIRDIQAAHGHIPADAVRELARLLGMSEVDVEGVVTFYHFFSLSPGENTPSISITQSRL